MSARALRFLSIIGLLVGCESERGVRLDVLLLTDYRPGRDFVEVRAEVLEEASASSVVEAGPAYLRPTDVARFALPRAARRRVQVTLVDEAGAVVQRSRIIAFRNERPQQQLTRICAECADFACPLGQTCECGTAPVCVPDECEGDDCTIDGCRTDTDCGPSGIDCVESVCVEGSCLRSASDARCAAAQFCDVELGCVTEGSEGDAGMAGDAGVDAGPDPAPPRPLSPLSTSTVTSRRPTMRWALAPGTDGAEVTYCRDRDMTTGCEPPVSASGQESRPARDLAPGVWFWRLRGTADGRTGVESSVVWSFQVRARSAEDGVDTSWGSYSDFNGDGFADLVVGAPNASPAGRGGAGTASVYLGSASGVATEPSLVLEGASAGDGFGVSVASAGDVNGDGIADLVVGSHTAAPGGRTNAGAVSIFLGSAGGLSPTPSTVLTGTATGDGFGISVAGVGDVDGDGFADVAIGAPLADPGLTNAGSVAIYAGSRTGLSTTPASLLVGINPDGQFGISVSSAGDVNGDRFSDLVVGAYGSETATVYLGSPVGISLASAVVLEGASVDLFGRAVTAADVNGDGFADVAVGAPGADPGGRMDAGAVSVFVGSSVGVTSAARYFLEGSRAFDLFGVSVASSDADGDGFSDLIVGASLADPGGRDAAGTASAYRGSLAGLVTTPAVVLEGVTSGDSFGSAVASGGDFDGDGFADVVIGAESASPGGLTNAGAVTVYFGGPAGSSFDEGPTIVGATADDAFGLSIASAAVSERSDVEGASRSSAPIPSLAGPVRMLL
jgi:hypothetical protein